ncbi:MAG: NodT family RND efflux system outer membrane lipoprotein [bacterium]|nr:MAG: NodT family RND efflux system outer membrane lipoprotein [bacterium]KAF0149657.1 MAG: NodT family RND efflux system outer membrane lipoprotein [bacterium]KAF0169323.1 MAG: NodT family RND efflux system outer membrane lipoprotein [bacterium]TXT21403.1 MAG: NodT family RND efflux system outer membrane lipoprotein [bacterium]
MRKLLSVAAAAFLMSGCVIGPDYFRPQVNAPQQWRTDYPDALNLADTRWWEQFQDPVLNDLIRSALDENKDLRIATARVEEFAGRLQSTNAPLFPQIGYQAGVGRQRVSEQSGPSDLPAGVDPTYSSYAGVLTASWELDVWGRIRRLTEASRADLLASEEGRRTVILTLVSTVASGYISLRGTDRQLEITRATAETYLQTLRLFELRYKGGVINEMQLAQVRSQYEQASARIPVLEQQVARLENALSVLLGRNPGPIPRGKAIDELVLGGVPAGLPSDLLERRPDILAAEQSLVSANARIGAARALYYPSISLTGFLGSTSTEFSDLFSGATKTWSFAGSLIGPIFDGGAIDGTVAQAEARQRSLLHAYQQTIQNAFREVDDALVDYRKSGESLAAQSRDVEALKTYARLANLRFEAGYSDYLEVLDAQRSLFTSQLNFTQSQALRFQSLVNIYKALGGGWVNEADKLTSSKPKLAEAAASAPKQ